MDIHTEYISSAVNPTPLGIDWGSNGMLCRASSSGVTLYDTESGKVRGSSSRSTKEHEGKATCVKWVAGDEEEGRLIVSGGSGGRVILWRVEREREEQGLCVLHPVCVLVHKIAVYVVDAILMKEKEEEEEEKVLVLSATSDLITSWIITTSTGVYEKVNSMTVGGGVFPLSLRVLKCPFGELPLAIVGGHDGRVYVLSSREVGVYEPVCVLKGHEDWVTSLDATVIGKDEVILASGSKDTTIRLWKFSRSMDERSDYTTTTTNNTNNNNNNNNNSNSNNSPSSPGDENASSETQEQELRVKRIEFSVPSGFGEEIISVELDAVLSGHEGLVSEVCWSPQAGHHRLLSCSKTQDRCIIIWEPAEERDTDAPIWVETARLGEVGGNMEGFFSAQFSDDGCKVLGCSYQGGLHMWRMNEGMWDPCFVTGGHFNQVVDISWERNGRYLLSVSKDQTTRLHAEWKTSDNKVVWCEIARPQVHGHDMSCVTALQKNAFVSGSEEKVVRGFSAPANFIRNFGQICGYEVASDIADCEVGEGASVPSLGLSNKAVTKTDLEEEGEEKEEQGREAYFKPLSLHAPPTEDQLMQNTLWPETAKLYGHGNEVFAVASTSDGLILASSCRAANEVDAAIILWDIKSWKKIDTLKRHRLTVTQLAFSPDNQYLLSVSRDRTWGLFTRTDTEKGVTYKPTESCIKKQHAHTRIIWSCAWLADSTHFMTASRDKCVCVWHCGTKERKALVKESDEVTALDVLQEEFGSYVCIAIGLVNGAIHIRKYDKEECVFSPQIYTVTHSHLDTVRRLQFRPGTSSSSSSSSGSSGGNGGSGVFYLASCSNDCRVNIYRLSLL